MTNACLFSGGKDSTLALHMAMAQGIKIDLLITMQTENEYSYMFHYPNIDATKLQAEALGIKQIIIKTKGVKEEELMDLEAALVDNDVKLIVSGAIASTYQRDRINIIAKKHGIKSITPLWGIAPEKEFAELIENYEVIIVQVSADGFDESFIGGKIDLEMVERLQKLYQEYGISQLFEGGEAETFVLNAPLFQKRIVIDQADKIWDGKVGRYLIQKARLVDKDK